MLERLVTRFCNEDTYLNWLERQKLRFYPSYCLATYKNSALQVSKDQYWCFGASQCHFRYDSTIL